MSNSTRIENKNLTNLVNVKGGTNKPGPDNDSGEDNLHKKVDVDYSPFLLSPSDQQQQQQQMSIETTLKNSSSVHEVSQQQQQKLSNLPSPGQTNISITKANLAKSKVTPNSETYLKNQTRSNSEKESTSIGAKRSHDDSLPANNEFYTSSDKNECDHCRRRQTKCVQVPNLKNCVQCESKGIKCTYSEIASNKTNFELEQIKKRVDENVNVHDLLKRTKFETSTNSSKAPPSNVYMSQNNVAHASSNNMNQNFNSLQSILDQNNMPNGMASPGILNPSNGILSPEILNAISPMNFNNNNSNNFNNALVSALSSMNGKGNSNNNGGFNNNILSGIVNNLLINNMNQRGSQQQQNQMPKNNFNNNDFNFSYIPKNNSNNKLQNFNNDNSEFAALNQTQHNLSSQSLANLYSQLTGQSMPAQPIPPNSFFSNNMNSQNPKNPTGNTAPSYPRSSFYLGPTSLIDYNLINHVKVDKIDQIQISPSLALRKVAPNVQFLLRDDFNEKLYLKQEQELDLVEKLIHPHGKTLVDIFFKLVHPHYPILHEKVFMEKYSRSYRELTTPLLASIYCLALEWWDFHPQLIGFPKPDVRKSLMDIALRSFFEVVERPKLSIVQAGLLILKCRSDTANNWVIASEVVALAEELGLGIDCQDWRLPKWERGLRRRLAWAVWSMEKWTSANEGRFSHLILGRNWLVKMLSDEDFPNDIGTHSILNKKNSNNNFSGTPNTNVSNNTPNNVLNGAGLNSNGQSMMFNSIFDSQLSSEDIKDKKQLFQQYVSLSIILGEILDTFYTLGAMSVTNNIEYVLKLAKPLQLKLREWYHSLPSKLSMNHLEPGKFNSNAALTLAYFGTEICLHRKILTTLDIDKSAANTPELKRVCRDAAKTRVLAAIDFVSDLKLEHINGFWYSCSSNNLSLIGSFIALLYCTSELNEEKTLYRDYLKKYISILKTTLASFQKAQIALEFSQLLDDILI
ncbi:hypothetical protein QEN19_002320 [Hanseniaspora menglaensis]